MKPYMSFASASFASACFASVSTPCVAPVPDAEALRLDNPLATLGDGPEGCNGFGFLVVFFSAVFFNFAAFGPGFGVDCLGAGVVFRWVDLIF